MGISGISGISYFYPVYNATPISAVRGSDKVTRGSDGTAQATVDGAKSAEAKGVGKTECKTCAERKYIDGSDEGDVSFQTPTHIDPAVSGAVVMGHEKEHVANAVAEGNKKNKELVSASVRLHTSVCPECGRTYVSGGVTETRIKTFNENANSNPYADLQKRMNYGKFVGANFDVSA